MAAILCEHCSNTQDGTNSAGTLKSDPGQFDWPNGVWLNKDNEIYNVCDRKNHSPWWKSAVNKNNREARNCQWYPIIMI